MSLKISYSSIFVFIFLAPYIILAQETSDSLKVELDPIEVTAISSTISASDAPLSLSTYTRDLQALNHDASESLTSIDQELPGLWVNNRQNYALGERLTIRGIGWRAQFGVRGIQVVLNDMPLTVADGQTMLNIVDPAFIREAELIRGPAATYWGNSSGGVLYLSTTPDYSEEGVSSRLRTTGGSFGIRKGEAEVSYSSDTHKLTAYSSYLHTNGYRDYSSAKVARAGLTGSVKLTSKSQLKYHAAGIYMPEAEHPSGLTAQRAQETPTAAVSSFVDAGAGKEITQGQAGLSYLLDTTEGIITLTGYGIWRDLINPLPFGIITVDRGVGGLRATFDKNIQNLDLQVGVETKYQNDNRTEYDNINGGNRGPIQVDQIEQVWNQALFTTATFTLSDFNLLGGVRYDRLQFNTEAPTPDQSGNRTFDSISPSMGINYQPAGQTIFLNVSTSFEAPTTTELVNRPEGGNGFNPALNPERTVGLEAGIRGNIIPAISYDLTTYRLWIQDLLFPYQLETDGPTYYRNQGETNHMGIEGKISWRLNGQWKISTIANLTHAEFIQAETADGVNLSGNEVPGIPDYRMNSQISWSPGNFMASASHEYVSSYTADNLNTAVNDAYNVIDAKVSYLWDISEASIQWQPFININNIFNVRYNSSVVVNTFGGRYFEPAPGRNFRMGLSLNF